MRKNIILLLIIFICSHANAEKLIFSNNNEQVNITGDVVIDNQNGDITVTTAGGNFIIVNENQPVILGFYPDSYATTVLGSVGVSWSVANADTCVASTVSGDSDWSGSKTATDGKNPPTPEAVTFNTLPTTIRLVCSNGNDSVSEEFTVVEQSSQVLEPTINFFRVNGVNANSINLTGTSASAIISWSTSDVANCEASSSPTLQDWNNVSVGTSGTTQSIPISQTTTVTLTCDNLPARNILINYSPGVDPSCSGIAQPPLITQSPIETTYTELNDGFAFGTSDNTNAIMTFNIAQTAQISGLRTSNVNYYRKLQFFPTPSDLNSSGGINLSISECPGDFTSTAVCVVKVFPNSTPQVRLTTNPNETRDNFCIIEPNKDYYMNMIHDWVPFDSEPGKCLLQGRTTCSIFFNELNDNGS